MSDNSRAIVPVGQRGVVSSVSRQIAITEKVLGRILESGETSVLAVTKLINFVPDLDDKIYDQIKPHLDKAWEAAKAAYGQTAEALDSFVNNLIGEIGEQIIPYLKKFWREVKVEELIHLERNGRHVQRAASDGLNNLRKGTK